MNTELMQLGEPGIPLKEALKKATAARVAAEAEFDKLEKGECEEAFDTVLRRYKIVRAVYWGGRLTARDSFKLMENWKAIITDLKVELKKLKRGGVEDSDIDEVLDGYESLLETFYPVCRIMRSVEKQSGKTIDAFETLCKAFGVQFRAMCGHVPPKVHVLESHLPNQLRRFRCLGLFSEDPIERLHHTQGVKLRLWASIRDYQGVEKYMDEVVQAGKSAAVTAVGTKAGERTKRKWSEETMKRRRERELLEEKKREEDMQAILNKNRNEHDDDDDDGGRGGGEGQRQQLNQ